MLKQVLEHVSLVEIDVLQVVRDVKDDVLRLAQFSSLSRDVFVDVVVDALAFAFCFAHQVEQRLLVIDGVRRCLATNDRVLVVLVEGALGVGRREVVVLL